MVPGVVSKPTKLTHPNVAVHQLVGIPPIPRRFIAMTGCFTGARIGVHATCLSNIHRGIMERVFYVKDEFGQFVPTPQPFTAFHFPKFVQHIQRKCGVVNPYTFDKFIGCYVARKRAAYESARQEVAKGNLSKRHSFIQAFGKVEKIDFGAKPDAVQRVVSPRDKRYNISVGLYIKAMEHPIYRAIDDLFGGPTVMKCLNYQQRASAIVSKWARFSNPVAIRADAKRFDQHVSEEALGFEHSVYLKLCPTNSRSELRKLLSWQMTNRGFVRTKQGTIKYKVRAKRASGDMNTGLGNVLIMCALLWEYKSKLGLRFELVDDGDDYVIITDRSEEDLIYSTIQQFFISYGFEMDVANPVYLLEELQFCQTQPVWDGEDWIMVRTPHMGLMKDTSSMVVDEFVRNGHIVSQPNILRTIGKGGLSLCRGIPIYDALYTRFVELGGDRDCEDPRVMTGFMYHAKRMGNIRSGKIVTEHARISFYRAFGLEPAVQMLLEERIKTWNPLRCLQVLTEVVDPVGIPV